MQASPHRNASTTENRHPLHVIQALLIAGVCMLAGGGIWYLAITGIIGRKKWDFMLYGLKPAILAGCGALVIIGTVLAFFLLPGLKNWSRPVARDLWKDRYRYSLIIPGLIIVFVFSYMPMYGIVLGFKDYKIKSGIVFSECCPFSVPFILKQTSQLLSEVMLRLRTAKRYRRSPSWFRY